MRDTATEAMVALLGSLLGRVEAREMFGAVGLYLDGTQFGLITDGRVLFRADQINRDDFAAPPADEDGFAVRGDLPGDLPWRPLPGEVLDDGERLRQVALRSWEAARRARKA